MKKRKTQPQPLRSNHRTPWSEREILYVESTYLTEPMKDIASALGRTPRAIQAMYYKLHAPLKHERWSAEELSVLRSHYTPGCDVRRLQPYFPDRSLVAIKAMTGELGLQPHPPFWNKRELDILRRYYVAEGSHVVARLKNRTPAAIRIQARKMKLRYQGSQRYRPWSEEERQRLRQLSHLTPQALAEHFPGRSINAVLSARRRLYSISLMGFDRSWSPGKTALLCFLMVPGSVPAASNVRASSRNLRAWARGTSG